MSLRFFSNSKEVLVLNGLLLAIYCLVSWNLDIPLNAGIMFSAVDAGEYLSTSTEFYKFSEQGYSLTRPFLLPLIVLIVYGGFGVKGLWLFQFFCWILSANLIYMALRRAKLSVYWSGVGTLLFAANLCLITLTYHALTESVCSLLLAALVFHISTNRERVGSVYFFNGVLLVLVLLTVIKPLFYLPLLGWIFFVLPVYYGKAYLSFPRKFVYFLLICIPLVFQFGLMKMKYDKFTVSEIGSLTFRRYIFTQVYQEKHHLEDRDSTLLITDKFSPKEVNKALLTDWQITAKNFANNIYYNIKSDSVYLNYPEPYKHPKMSAFMTGLNKFYLILHLLFLVSVMYLFVKGQYSFRDLFTTELFPGLLVLYILITSGISFYQGDRLVISAVPLFAVVYPVVLSRLFKRTAKVQ